MFLKSSFQFLAIIQVIAIESPKANWLVVLDVGTKFPGPASLTLGIKTLTSGLYNKDCLLDVIPIKFIFLFLVDIE